MLQAYQTTRVVPPSGKLVLEALSLFQGQRVRVIVLEDTEEEKEDIDRQERCLKILRSMPVWSEESIQRIEQVRQEFNQWQIPSL